MCAERSPESGELTRRVVPATFGRAEPVPDPQWQVDLADWLRKTKSEPELMRMLSAHRAGEDAFDLVMRRALMRALCRHIGHGLHVEAEVVIKNPETISLGDQVFIGAGAMIQARHDGMCRIGNHVWIGPHAYLDARCVEIEDYVGWGPGAKLLGSAHTGEPADVPLIQTSLEIKPVVVGYGADIGTNATILPGVTIGAHAIVGAGAVVVKDVPERAVVAGVPARVIRTRKMPEYAAAKGLGSHE